MATRHSSLIFSRPFHTTPPTLAKSTSSRLTHLHRNIPPYPYGPSHTYKQSNFGLYGNTHIQFGNKVSSRNEIKTRRKWKPNIRNKHLYSAALGRTVRTRVSARVLRTIEKEGGLDEYLLGEKPARIKELGMGGWRLRWRVMQTETVRRRFEEERTRLGLLDGGGSTASDEEIQAEIREYDRQLDRGDEVAVGEEAETGASLMEEKHPDGTRPTL
ncbi:MAG: 39S ribosomal protein L24, mitochondrial [Geoglossum simile]|nr:MAG: 39S ribosomal protein L24, mitochondrial [Geoglossum simile]